MTSYPAQITALIRYTPTAELSHAQLLQLHELKLPAIEDLSWEHVVSSSCVKLRNYTKVYEARAEGLRLPRSRLETDIFFTALLHARRETPSVMANVLKECLGRDNEREVHEDVIGLILENDVAFRCVERYGTDELARVARFISDKNVNRTDKSTVKNVVGIAEELAEVALNKIKQVKGEREMVSDMGGVMETLKLGGPWEGWCGMKGGIRNRKM
ncbi:hypothetical protein BWQ96_03140 [Gracilariopsis chorda]|uniref:Uncharacterized protein n=1 Tax=Gracilariopsis chorda TaxID=448386 RepID=A0A2V3IYC1_9FLOR|nr:hypothetical protein BWQ96_03140 [Gracilariopsis chorda]|eukprot:PXF47063.1 hypothetical protein BWQ96_03140 [Gracilariopsis chorda]